MTPIIPDKPLPSSPASTARDSVFAQEEGEHDVMTELEPNNNENNNTTGADDDNVALSSRHQGTITTSSDDYYSSRTKYFRFALVSNLFFLIGAVLYVSLAFVDMDYEKRYDDLPDNVKDGDEYEWYGYGWTDDYILKEITKKDVWVSKSQILYFCAALCFTITGVLDFWYRPAYFAVVMMAAGIFGLLSAMLIERNERNSMVFNSISVHLFGLEAVEALFFRPPVPGIELWIRGGDLCFLVATIVDITLSYRLLKNDYYYGVTGAQLAVFGSFMWVATAIVYISSTIYIQRNQGLEGTTKFIKENEMPGGLVHNDNNDDDDDNDGDYGAKFRSPRTMGASPDAAAHEDLDDVISLYDA